MIVYSELATEISTDPDALGYAGKSDIAIADLMNAISINYSIDISLVQTWQVLGATTWSEWNGLSAAAKQLYDTFISAGELDLRNTNIRAAFAFMFGAGTATRTALAALQSRPGSRAEALFGQGAFIRHTDIAIALGRG